jgi:hypothetical protein
VVWGQEGGGKVQVKRQYNSGMNKLTKAELAEWEELRGRMLTSLDDHDAESFEKFKATAAKKLRRRGLEEPPIDKAAVIRFLLLYGKLDKAQGKCIKESGIDKVMLLTAYELWPESHFVRNYIAKTLKKLHELENEDILEEARASLRKLNTVNDCKLNAKSVLFTVAGLDRENFGKKEEGGGGAKQQIVYNIPNLTMNMIMSPSELEAKGVKQLEKEPVIEAELV